MSQADVHYLPGDVVRLSADGVARVNWTGTPQELAALRGRVSREAPPWDEVVQLRIPGKRQRYLARNLVELAPAKGSGGGGRGE